MISYFRIYLLFLIPSYIALSLGFFYSYKQHTTKTKRDFKEKYKNIVESYAMQMSDLDRSYERIMRTALFGISNEIESASIAPEKLRRIARKYNVSHLFVINRDGRFLKSTNEEPSKIPNLYSFSDEYRKLINSNPGSYLTTPVILPFPEKEPHKFLTTWSNGYFIEVGFKITEIAKTLEAILKQDDNVKAVDLKVGDSVYSIGGSALAPTESMNIKKEVSITNQFFAQSERENSHTYRMEFKISKHELFHDLAEIRKTYWLNFVLTLSLMTLLLYIATKLLRKRVKTITSQIAQMVDEKAFNKSLPSLSTNKDFDNLIKAINNLLSSYRESSDKAIQYEKDLVYKNTAFQVAHDIRSPLEALKASKEELALLPQEDKRNILMAISRIEEIAYNLLKTRKREIAQENASTHLVSQLEQILIEKKLQYRDFSSLDIKSEVEPASYSCFTTMSAENFKRIVSNIVTNAAEALDYKGLITIQLKNIQNEAELTIVDTGPGIPTHVLPKLFAKGFTTKENGNGLGLHSAKTAIEALGGNIHIECNHGTRIVLRFPSCVPKSNFTPPINLKGINKIIILDDDESIHSIWKKKLSNHPLKLEHFYTSESLLTAYSSINSDCLLLTDYELLGESITGIDCIQKLSAERQSILVTARHEEDVIQSKTVSSGMRLLPKSSISLIPIVCAKLEEQIVLIDDDELCQLGWKRRGIKLGLEVRSYSSVDEFLQDSTQFERDTRIYIDSNLGNGLKGEIESEKIFKLGFGNLFLATGYQKEDIQKPAWIKEIYSKDLEAISAQC